MPVGWMTERASGLYWWSKPKTFSIGDRHKYCR